MKNDKGFTLVEVIIALVILSAAIISFGAAFNMYMKSHLKEQQYQQFYITALSLIDLIETKKLTEEPEGAGRLNGFEYSYQAKNVRSARNYAYNDFTFSGGNIGPFEIILFTVECRLSKDHLSKGFTFYVTQHKKAPALTPSY